jgi:hypothetical protein
MVKTTLIINIHDVFLALKTPLIKINVYLEKQLTSERSNFKQALFTSG